ncbi:MAG TPA: carboxypeptidase regulatory-like domain-containing protein [Candidatus Saccharimonadales bacterium]|nr:carboxypeptidase regulatory-like domain-containing protein [Candidatus Saccharimonadales bacterium]
MAVPLFAGMAAAVSATLSMSPSPATVVKGGNVTVAIYENSGSEPVNAVQANITYPTSSLQFVSITSSAAFGVTAQNSGGGGNVQIARGTITAVTGSQLVASVTFKALVSSGSATLSFVGGSAVVSATSNTNIMTSDPGTSVSFKAAPSTTPPSSSSSGSSSNTAQPAAPKDTTPPTISAVTVTDRTATSATIEWTTSEAATSTVLYGLTTGYGLTASNSSLTTHHTTVLQSALIVPGTTYHFMVNSADAAGNLVKSGDSSFTTEGASLFITVRDTQSGKPIAGAQVQSTTQTVLTDRNGAATLSGLPIGKSTIVISMNGRQFTQTVAIGSDALTTAQPVTFKIASATRQLPGWSLWMGVMLVLAAGGAGGFFIGRRRQQNRYMTPRGQGVASAVITMPSRPGILPTQPPAPASAPSVPTQPPASVQTVQDQTKRISI